MLIGMQFCWPELPVFFRCVAGLDPHPSLLIHKPSDHSCVHATTISRMQENDAWYQERPPGLDTSPTLTQDHLGYEWGTMVINVLHCMYCICTPSKI